MAVVLTGSLVDGILLRMRDPGGDAHPRSLVRSLLTAWQRLLNGKFAWSLETLTLSTEAWRQVYPIAALLENAVRVVAVREGTRDLIPVTWTEFWYVRRTWLRDVGPRYDEFALVGRDVLVLYPAQREATSVSVVVARLTADLTDDTVAVEIPDDYVPLLMNLVELTLLLRTRIYDPMKVLTEAIKMQMAA